MYKKYHILIVITFLLYSFQVWIKHYSSIQGFLRDYFGDLLATPLILTFGLIVVRKVKRLPYFYLTKGMMIFTLVYTSILFEFNLPKFYSKFTSDFIDVVYYTIGTIIFFLLQEKLKKDEYYKTIDLHT